MKFLLASVLVASASAACPNSCSGHGTCGASEVCTCYDGWGTGGAAGGDCSDRFCAFELAWVDSPDKQGRTHNYAECAGKGICDREIGECECFAGYEGKGCGRQVCPDSCSGHGTCELMNELTYGSVFADYYDGSTGYTGVGVGAVRPSGSSDLGWDSDRARACACDSGWAGVNCGQRQCPEGNDPIDTRADTSDDLQVQSQTISLISGGVTDAYFTNTTSKGSPEDFKDKSFALAFTAQNGERFVTNPISYGPQTATGFTPYASQTSSTCAIIDGTPSVTTECCASFTDTTTVGTIGNSMAAIKSAKIGGSTIDVEHVKYVDELFCSTSCYVGVVADLTAMATALSGTFTQATLDTACLPYQANGLDKVGSLAQTITSELLALPNRVIDGVTVKVGRTGYVAETTTHDGQVGLTLWLNSLEPVSTDSSTCWKSSPTLVERDAPPVLTELPRGKCDGDTGLCSCFPGFTGESCSTITALA
ncbi:hypothetical protein ScalyP_jg4271 [Parmales sp. scaly parma]|nr:hypothetical protein ScalyP_jg4271 [Parmales sp. scaly parma]